MNSTYQHTNWTTKKNNPVMKDLLDHGHDWCHWADHPEVENLGDGATAYIGNPYHLSKTDVEQLVLLGSLGWNVLTSESSAYHPEALRIRVWR